MVESKQNVDTIFLAAIEIASNDERQAYLEHACCGDAQVRSEVERLLRAHFTPGSFVGQLGAALDKTVDSPTVVGELGSLIGPYKLLEQIGEGGMGVVYMADQQAPVRRRVALKIIKPGMDTRQVIARFEAERQALALMDHPNIARVLDAGATDSGRPYFVMELVRGIPITQYCDQNNLAVLERLELFILVCQAVQHAHQKGIIHRDLKPSNVLVTLHDGQPVPKVIDFGLAKATNQQLTDKTLFTKFAQMVGTPLYMSPEQAEMSGLDVDTRTDIYSLGVLLYELLTGTTPYDRQRLHEAGYDEIRRIIREEEPPRPSTRISTLGETRTAIAARRKVDHGRLQQLIRGDLDWIVMKALEKDRTRRYETANALGRDVQRYLADQPVEACPPSTAYRFRKFARRNRVALTTGVLISAVLVLGTVVSTWQAVRATLAERAADAARFDEAQQRKLAEGQRFEAEQQRAKAEQQRAAAEANFEKARKAVDEYFTLVSESTLLDVPGLQPLRKDLLEAALRFYRDSTLERTNDPGLLADLAMTYLRVSAIYVALNRTDDAVAMTDRALDAIARLRREHPDDRASQLRLAGSWNGLRWTQMSIQFPQNPLAAFQTTLRLQSTWEKLAAEYPASAGFQADLSAIDFFLGGLLANTGLSKDGIGYCRKGLVITETLLAQYPKVPRYRADLAMISVFLATQLFLNGAVDEAQTLSRRAVELDEALAAEFPNVPAYREALIIALDGLGNELVKTGPREAEHCYRRAMELAKSLMDQFPDMHLHREVWMSAGIHLAKLATSMDNNAEAKDLLRELVQAFKAQLTVDPKDRRSREQLAALYSASARQLPADPRCADLGEQVMQRSADLFADLAHEFPSVPSYLEEVGHSYRRLGRLNCLTSRLDEAAKNFNISIELLDKLLADDPPNDKYCRLYKAAALSELSLVLDAQGHSQDAQETLRQSVGLYDKLFGDFPSPRSTDDRGNMAYPESREPSGRRASPRSAEDLRDTAYALYQHALVRLYFGDPAGYRRTCEVLKQWLGTTNDRIARYYLAWSCCVGADALGDLTVPITHIQSCLGGRPNDADLLTAMGIMLYRQGRFEEAAGKLNEAEGAFPTQKQLDGTVLYPRIFLAMLHQRLGHADEARRRLDEVRAELDRKPSEISWDHRLTMDIFRREAETLIPAAP